MIVLCIDPFALQDGLNKYFCRFRVFRVFRGETIMTILKLKPNHKAVKAYYNELKQLSLLDAHKEGAVSPAFANLLRACGKQFHWTLYEQYPLKHGGKNIYPDGAMVDTFNLPYGFWEAKDSQDDLNKEIKKKFEKGYPRDNILFQAPEQAILWQDGTQKMESDLTRPDELVEILKAFFEYQPPAYQEWLQAVEAFKDEVPKIGRGLLHQIEQERRKNLKFSQAFDRFVELCREALNPNIAPRAVEEMLIQHLMTERIFRKIFNNPDFVNLNLIASEIEKVVHTLIFPHGGRHEFFKPLNRFYNAIETTAALISDFSQKQAFLNTVYEKFFQGFSVKVADTHGIVYTPQPVVQFMVNSIEEILQTEFDRSLSDDGVHILDPFVGTGNFMIHVMQTLRKTALARKYAAELHCNEVMLLPYYIAAMNIEHEYMTLTGEYKPFEGICLVDTFQLAEPAAQIQFSYMTEENSARVKQQQKAPIFVILGNPPYNVGQINENDNNKNRKYPTMDQRVAETYAKDSNATNKNALSDVYVKAFRWASDRIEDEGVVAFITNSGFVDGFAFDGMRKHLAQDFDTLYILDLGGNVRQNPKLSGTTHNVFGIQVGVSINLLVKKGKYNSGLQDTADNHNSGLQDTADEAGAAPSNPLFPEIRCCDQERQPRIYYFKTDEYWRKEQKYQFLNEKQQIRHIEWQEITPDNKETWLTEGMSADFGTFIPMGTKAAKSSKAEETETIFKNYGRGVNTSRDNWVYNFQREQLSANIQRMIEVYNEHVEKFKHLSPKPNIDDFVLNDETKISWSRDLKLDLKRGNSAEFKEEKVRQSLYRPFTRRTLFFDRILNEEVYQLPGVLPTPETETENRIICVRAVGNTKEFHCLMTSAIPDVHLTGDSQCFPFYTYDEDGSNRRENITDWALEQFRARYDRSEVHSEAEYLNADATHDGTPLRSEPYYEREQREITKWDIFYYVYAILHHPQYREKYAANLKRELPRIPFVAAGDQFPSWEGQGVGKKSSELHDTPEPTPNPSQEGNSTASPSEKDAEVFWAFSEAGKKLADLHVNYEQQPAYKLKFIEKEGEQLDWRVEKMKLSKDKTKLIYNDFLTLDGIPPEAFEYRLGNRSALDWVIDQYRVKTDKRSGITNDPNRDDEPDYIVKLIQRVMTVSIETVKIVKELPVLEEMP